MRSRHGFTLIELLVVITIVVLLMSLLLPAFKQAREWAVVTRCGNNLRQQGICITAYTMDNRGNFPDPATTVWPIFNWQEKLTQYTAGGSDRNWRTEPVWLGNWDDGTGTNGVTASMYNEVMIIANYPSICSTKIFNDPVYKPSTSISGASNVAPQYGINMMLLATNNALGNPWNNRGNPWKLDQLGHPVVVGGPVPTSPAANNHAAFPGRLESMRHMSGLDATALSSMTPSDYNAGVGVYLTPFNGGDNLLWSDGHVAWTLANEPFFRAQLHNNILNEREFNPALP